MKGSPRYSLFTVLVSFAAASTLLATSCSAAEEAPEQAPADAQEAPVQNIDLSEAMQLFGQPPAAPKLAPTTVVATVNGEIITQKELDEEIERA
ncbi:MAG TPA: hypothetical protein VIH35_06450, partial [Kiritimatiellia bacterium]